VPDAAMRGFLLQNFRPGAGWRIGLAEIAAALPAIEGWAPVEAPAYAGPVLFVLGGLSDFVKPADRRVIHDLFPAVRFVTLRNAGHWVHADAPEAFVEVMRAAIG